MTSPLLKPFRFFFENAGYILGMRALCAINLAKAERYANENDWTAEWVNDDDPDLSWMSVDEIQQPHEVLGCVLKDRDGNVLASLWGIVDADRAYMRVIEAELALEALMNQQELARVCAE